MASVEQRFIFRSLENAGTLMLQRQEIAMRQEITERTGSLRQGRKVTVSEEGAYGGRLIFDHVIYERFLDMKHRDPAAASAHRKQRNIHNRYVFGMYNSVIYRLLYGLTADVRSQMVKEIQEIQHIAPSIFNGTGITLK